LVTIETNGDLEIEYKSLYDDIIFSISPKDEVQMKWYWTKNRNSYLKIVHNFGDISDLWIKNMSKVMDIFIMPKGESKKELELNRKEAFLYALANDYIFSDRDHINCFDKKKGR
jgi:hypothetical protein